MSSRQPRAGAAASWETMLLARLTPVANLMFVGLATFLLAIPVVTVPAAAAAGAVALRGTREDRESSPFLGSFRAFRATWRRTLGVSVLGTTLTITVAVNWVFLLTRESPLAILMLGALVPVTVVLLLVLIHFPAAVAWHPDGVTGGWLRTSLSLSLANPLRSLAICVVVATWTALCLFLPTIIPFFGVSVPVLVGLMSAESQRRRVGV